MAVDNVSLDLRPGITGLLGPNGAGKTTLLRMLATVQMPTSGSVTACWAPTVRTTPRGPAIRRRLGYLPQEFGFPPGFTAFGFLRVHGGPEGVDRPAARRAEVRRVLELVDLSAVSTKSVRKLSGGMRRRLVLAQALIGAPDLVLLDEPTTGPGSEPTQRIPSAGSRARQAGHRADLNPPDRGRGRRLRERGRHGPWRRPVPRPCPGVRRDRERTGVAGRWRSTRRRIVHQRIASGRYRHVGAPPPGAELTDPRVEDAYLLLQRPLREGSHG